MRQEDQSWSHNRQRLLATDLCGCFHCLAIFSPTLIVEWVDTDDQTALCPHCGIDTVVPSVPSRPVTKELLERLQRHGFGRQRQ